jgi:hypothetical protein
VHVIRQDPHACVVINKSPSGVDKKSTVSVPVESYAQVRSLFHNTALQAIYVQ